MNTESRGAGFFPERQESASPGETGRPEQPETRNEDTESGIKALSAEEEARIVDILCRWMTSGRTKGSGTSPDAQERRDKALSHIRSERLPGRASRGRGEPTAKTIEEIRGPEGGILGVAVVEEEPGEAEVRSPGGDVVRRGRRIRTVAFAGTAGSPATSVDLRQLTGLVETDIVVTSDHLPAPEYAPTAQGLYDFLADTAFVPASPTTPLAAATLFHELGHAAQFREDRYRQLGLMGHFYKLPWSLDREDLRFVIDAISRLMPPEVGGASIAAQDAEAFSKVTEDLDASSKAREEASRRVKDARRAQQEAEGAAAVQKSARLKSGTSDAEDAGEASRRMAMPELEAAERNLKAARDDHERLWRSRSALLSKPDGLRQMLMLPAMTLERDATRRALQWMRRLQRESGIDLLRAKAGGAIEGIASQASGQSCIEGPGRIEGDPGAGQGQFSVKEYLTGLLDKFGAGQSAARQIRKTGEGSEARQDSGGSGRDDSQANS